MAAASAATLGKFGVVDVSSRMVVEAGLAMRQQKRQRRRRDSSKMLCSLEGASMKQQRDTHPGPRSFLRFLPAAVWIRGAFFASVPPVKLLPPSGGGTTSDVSAGPNSIAWACTTLRSQAAKGARFCCQYPFRLLARLFSSPARALFSSSALSSSPMQSVFGRLPAGRCLQVKLRRTLAMTAEDRVGSKRWGREQEMPEQSRAAATARPRGGKGRPRPRDSIHA